MQAVSLMRHTSSGFCVDLRRGLVIGDLGRPVGVRNKYGYIEVRQYDEDGVQRSYHAHRLVWEAANGPVPPGRVIHHINGIKHDNRLTNLLALSQGENMADSRRATAGLSLPLTFGQKWAICKTWGLKTSAEWAEELGVDEASIHGIRLANLRECVAFSKGGNA